MMLCRDFQEEVNQTGREKEREESGAVGARRPGGVLHRFEKKTSTRLKVTQVWSAAIRHGERSESTKGPCLVRLRPQMTWKDEVAAKGRGSRLRRLGLVSGVHVSTRLPWNSRAPPHDGGLSMGTMTFGNARPAAQTLIVPRPSSFARQETAVGKNVIFHCVAHATSPAIKRMKKKRGGGHQPSRLVVAPSSFSVARPGANDFHALRVSTRSCAGRRK